MHEGPLRHPPNFFKIAPNLGPSSPLITFSKIGFSQRQDGDSLLAHTVQPAPEMLRVVWLIIALVVWHSLDVWAATTSTHQFGRYEIVLQEGIPVAMGEILGMVRRQTGLPEYPLMLGVQKRLLELNILGPGTRPQRLTASEFLWPAMGRAGVARFVLEGSVREGEMLTLRLRHANLPVQVSLALNLGHLERMLEGER
jgi:hypothetical protein